MRLFDTLSGRKREFKPLKGKTVRIYTCGPSVYNYSHIGNFRTYLFEDVLVRYLKYRGYKVERVMNITDVEDKSIDEAAEEGESLEMLVEDKIRAFFRDFDTLGMLRPEVVAKASDYVPEMVRMIEKICRKGYCIFDKDGVYFNVRKFKDYGRLHHMKNPKYLGVASRDDYAREGRYDFRLWKKWSKKDGKAKWDSPFGPGRPGWHIECSAISATLGLPLDIHCGAVDNIYPHHENEIAQSETVEGKKLANFWLHARHLTIGKKKMSKRTGNVYYVRELEKLGVPPECLRYYLISERYRRPLDFTIQQFKWRICNCDTVKETLRALRRVKGDGRRGIGKKIAMQLADGFESAMDDDLNTKLALRRASTMAGKINRLIIEKKIGKEDARQILAAYKKINGVLAVF